MMIANIFEEILRLSFYGTIAGLGVGLISPLIERVRAPRWIVLCLWGMVGIRLLCPVTIPSDFSIFRIEELSDFVEESFDFQGTYAGDFMVAIEGTKQYEEAVEAGSPVEETEYGYQMAYFYYDEVEETYAPAKTAHEASSPKFAVVWLCGIGILWLWAVADYVRLRMKLRFAMKISDGVYESDAIPSPCVVGIVRPKIYVTPNLSEKQKEHVLMHERMHIRYMDPLWKVVSFMVMSVHWFNPFLWRMYKVFQVELEMACDERVVRELGEEQKADYSESLLAMARERTFQMPTPIAFGETDTKDRIKTILRYRKPMVAATIGVVILAVIACAVLMTGSPNEEENAVPDATVDSSVFEELEADGVLYQAKRDGIHRIENGEDVVIYDSYAGVAPAMMVYENKLYFMTDSLYQPGALEWTNTTIRWLDLKSGETGDLEFSYNGTGMPDIYDYMFYDGMMLVNYHNGDNIVKDVFYLDEKEGMVGKRVSMLSEEESRILGQRISQMILKNENVLIPVATEIKPGSIFFLDMNNDGVLEEIEAEPLENANYGDGIIGYKVRLNDTVVNVDGYNFEDSLWAFAMKGESILLAVYDDGPSADPYTTFLQYKDGKFMVAGGFEADIRGCKLNGEIITGSLRRDIVQTDWIRVSWKQNAEGMIEMIPQETYDFLSLNEVDLLETLPIHKEIGSEEVFEVAPQKVVFLQVSGDWEWLYIMTADGQNGWIHVVDFEVVELQKNVLDVFEGVNLAG